MSIFVDVNSEGNDLALRMGKTLLLSVLLIDKTLLVCLSMTIALITGKMLVYAFVACLKGNSSCSNKMAKSKIISGGERHVMSPLDDHVKINSR